MTPKISVIIPCYNQGHYLAAAIDSVLAQRRDDVEIIVINDGSPDNTAAVAQPYGNQIVYIEQENRGLSGARNRGIDAATGQYIAFLDSDDIYLPRALTTLATYLDQHPDIALVCGDVILFDETGDLGLKSVRDGRPKQPENIRWEIVGYYITPSSVLVRSVVFETVGAFDEALKNAAEDWLMWIEIARCYNMAYIDKPLARYRQHANNATRDVEQLAAGNRYAIQKVVESERFSDYPAAFRSELLYYYFATIWHTASKPKALRILGQAIWTAPRQIHYLGFIIRRAWRQVRHIKLTKKKKT